MHLRALRHRFTLRRANVVDIIPDAAAAYAEELAPEVGFEVRPVPLQEREGAVRASDIVFTVTTGDQSLVELEWLKPGAFVGRLGSYQEIALEVLTGADKVIVDNWHYVRPRIPELEMLAQSGTFGREDIYAEWPEIVGGRRPGRESVEEVIVYLALGIWGEYAAILPEVYRRALSLGLGLHLPRSGA
jgi:ornithine cyclodeaminase/alanine dehydrogenase-like protein (mu-crystallin family)